MKNNNSHFLFIFVDGIGLGKDDSKTNPLVKARMPNLTRILGGKKLVISTIGKDGEPYITDKATLISLDCILGVEGYPQSATGQATILTGKNVPQLLGYHFGPKPSPEIKNFLEKETIFHVLTQKGFTASLLNGYPQTYFENIESGKRLPGAIAMAAKLANISLKNTTDMKIGQAISADLTGRGWRERLKIPGIPVYSPSDSGKKLAQLSQKYDFSFFEYWLSDYAGHRADMAEACDLLALFDDMLGGLVNSSQENLIFITSDHGNLEDLSNRRHTINPVPGLILGPRYLREKFISGLESLADIAPAIYRHFDL